MIGSLSPLYHFAADAAARVGGFLCRFMLLRECESRLRGLALSTLFQSKGLRVGRNVTITNHRLVKLGDAVTLYQGVQLLAGNVNRTIDIGHRTHIDVGTVIHGLGGVEIGSKCAIAAGVIIYSQTNRYDRGPDIPIVDQGTRLSPVTIGDDVWIGAGAIVLPGVKIGSHAVIGAGSVVASDVAQWKIAAGVPARTIKDRRTQ